MKKQDLIEALQAVAEQDINLESVPIFASASEDGAYDVLKRFHGKPTADAFQSVYGILKQIRRIGIFRGRGLQSIDGWMFASILNAAILLLRRAHQTGDAVRVVNGFYAFLMSNEADAQYITALTGLHPSECIELDTNLYLMPFSDVPASYQKEGLLQMTPPRLGSFTRGAFRQPTAALVLNFQIKPALVEFREIEGISNIDFGDTKLPNNFGDLFRELRDICQFFTLVGPTPVVQIGSWTRIDDSNPMAQLPRGFHSPMHEIDPYPPLGEENRVTEISADSALAIFSCYRSIPRKIKDSLRIPLDRLNLAMRRANAEDRAIELGIALESLLLNDIESYTPLSYQLRLRGALLHGGTETDRANVYDLLHDIYDLRSKAAHGGKLKIRDKFRNGQRMKTESRLWQGIELCAHLIRKVAEQKKWPDWKSLVLGIAQAN